MLFIGGARIRNLAAWSLALGLAGAYFAYSAPYRRRRIFAYLDPFADPLGDGLQTIQSQVGIASGGLLGVGLGAGRTKWGSAYADSGLHLRPDRRGGRADRWVCRDLAFLLFGYFGVRVALKAPDRFGMLLAVGITTWLIPGLHEHRHGDGADADHRRAASVRLRRRLWTRDGARRLGLLVNVARRADCDLGREGVRPNSTAGYRRDHGWGHGRTHEPGDRHRSGPGPPRRACGADSLRRWRRGNEGTLVPAAGFEIDLLPGRGIQRSLRPSSIVDNLGAVAGLLDGARRIRSCETADHRWCCVLAATPQYPMSAAAILARVPS
ncbi:MAG: FtsW/RodA/SpoVE family cell cycle protein [Acidimicrobiales bacterium]